MHVETQDESPTTPLLSEAKPITSELVILSIRKAT